MLTLHHLENSRSHRILWLLEELGVKYEMKFYERDPATKMAPPELREIHPLGKAPVVTDGDNTLAESAAIIEYIVDRYGEGRLRPETDTPEYLRYQYWMHYAEGSAMTPILLKVILGEFARQAPLVARPVMKLVANMADKEYLDGQLALHMKYWEGELEDRSYFVADEFTAADIQMIYPLEGALAATATPEEYPNLLDLVERLRGREAYQKAVEVGGEVLFEL